MAAGLGHGDRYLREAMFGPRFPRLHGREGVPGLGGGSGLDHELPGFGPFGTAGAHCFDSTHPLYLRTAAITAARADFPVLRFQQAVPATRLSFRRAVRARAGW